MADNVDRMRCCTADSDKDAEKPIRLGDDKSGGASLADDTAGESAWTGISMIADRHATDRLHGLLMRPA